MNDLDEVERVWTGDTSSQSYNGRQEIFSTNLIYRTWLSEKCEMERELSFLAVPDEAVSALFGDEGFYELSNPRTIPYSHSCYQPPEAEVQTLVQKLHSTSSCFNLRAAISRLSMNIGGEAFVT